MMSTISRNHIVCHQINSAHMLVKVFGEDLPRMQGDTDLDTRFDCEFLVCLLNENGIVFEIVFTCWGLPIKIDPIDFLFLTFDVPD